jgi:hypothetical protein
VTRRRKAPAAGRTRIGPARRIVGWIGAWQQAISDRVHADDDAFARAQGWTVTASTGRFGFGTRTYRDPRFDRLRRPPGPARLAEPAGPTDRPQPGEPSSHPPGRQHDVL